MQDTLFQEQYQKLNPEQKEAVDTLYGPVMVVAGPGTGKTQIIGMRTANILRETDTDPGSILITTFTEAGVIAIRERLISFIGNEAYKVNVSTIHSFASGVIERFPEKFIEYRTAKAIDDVEQIEVIKQILDLLIEKKQIIELTSEYDRYFYLRDIKSKISTLKQEGINVGGLQAAIKQEQTLHAEELALIKPKKSGEMPKKYETTKERQEKQIAKLEELVLLFQEYNAWLRSNSSYDFNDMINFVLEKFGQDEDLLLYYAEKFQFIMLDEYQDTNNAQNEIIKLIV
ncbi:MAG: UvrD-helicase domain-containing protein [Candidatus Peribacteria bacterium]|nr:MAG: UvrD-helicase domain-containing protein [Candidatus Peribacteria bacterium]